MKEDQRFSNLNGICDLRDLGDLARVMVQTRKKLSYPLIYRLLKLALILPVATRIMERYFSTMKLVKSNMRNRTGDTFLSDCFISVIEKRNSVQYLFFLGSTTQTKAMRMNICIEIPSQVHEIIIVIQYIKVPGPWQLYAESKEITYTVLAVYNIGRPRLKKSSFIAPISSYKAKLQKCLSTLPLEIGTIRRITNSFLFFFLLHSSIASTPIKSRRF